MYKIFKRLLFSFFFSIAINANAFDKSVLAENYPDFQDYQSIALRELNNYFSTLLIKSIVNQEQKNSYQIETKDDSGNTLSKIYVRIERKRLEDSLTESVHFILTNGNRLDYTLKREGLNLVETPNIKLITLNLNNIEQAYELSFNQLKLRFLKQKIIAGLEKTFIFMGIMEINISIETKLEETKAVRNYIYFYAQMPNPQTTVTVQVDNIQDQLRYTHALFGAEIAPKIFFESLAGGNQVLSVYSQISLNILNMQGFPII